MNLFSVLLALAPVSSAVFAERELGSRPLFAISLTCFAGMFVLPQRWPRESWRQSVARVARRVATDRVFFVMAAFLVMAAIPLFNVGLCPGCDWRAIREGANPLPPFRWLPFCVRPMEHEAVLSWFAPVFATIMFVRNGLTRHGRRVLFECLVWIACALALYGFARQFAASSGAKGAFSVFGYANMAGAYFAFCYALALGLWSRRMVQSAAFRAPDSAPRHPILAKHYPLAAVALTGFASFATLCRAAMLFVIAFTFLFFVYAMLASLTGRHKVNRFAAMSSIMVLLALVVTVMTFSPPDVGRELATLNVRTVSDRASGKGQYHERVALAIFRDFPLFGVGGWGYRHFCTSYMTEKELKSLQSDGGANVHNDYLQFLCEHGIVGFGLLAAFFFLLVKSVVDRWREVYDSYRFVQKKMAPVSPIVVYAVSPPVLWTMVGVVALLLQALGDCPFRSPAVLATELAALAAVTGYF